MCLAMRSAKVATRDGRLPGTRPARWPFAWQRAATHPTLAKFRELGQSWVGGGLSRNRCTVSESVSNCSSDDASHSSSIQHHRGSLVIRHSSMSTEDMLSRVDIVFYVSPMFCLRCRDRNGYRCAQYALQLPIVCPLFTHSRVEYAMCHGKTTPWQDTTCMPSKLHYYTLCPHYGTHVCPSIMPMYA